MSLRGFATLNIWADDVAAAESWYAEFLGTPAYFHRNGPDGKLAYAEFRVGDFEAELGIIDRRWAPAGTDGQPAGAIMHWHVDDLEGTVERLLALGAKQHMPITAQGDQGFVTASVVDPFGNVLGVMYNPHYVEITGAARPQ
ncbi:VOC family protein [Actinoplanes sp. NBRC 103695]|uniref:VOC family protein n=1 Tax=Actinoplanes sp. NBRC 103695 TaxID=3032202 RepID=UPI0025569E52|nr:VOC family protein [Actinoplanes sp. NBRC 103695]